jgi:DNA-binding MarR family transcriptional regulator
MQADFLHGLLDLAAAYEKGGGHTADFNRADFVSWLLTTQQQEASLPPQQGLLPPVDGLIAMYVSMMGRYADFYARRIFRDSVIYSLDDWGVLVSLFPDRIAKKTEVLRMSVMEKSSGNEVLKRMLRQELIAESPNPDDHRSKLICLTDAGRAAFLSVDARMRNLSNLVVADLTGAEKSDLLTLLFKLSRYHQPIFEAADEADLERRLMGSGE